MAWKWIVDGLLMARFPFSVANFRLSVAQSPSFPVSQLSGAPQFKLLISQPVTHPQSSWARVKSQVVSHLAWKWKFLVYNL